MKRLLLAMMALTTLLSVDAQNLLPVRDSIGKLSVSVDPRMELLGAVQLVSGYPHCTKNTPYSARMQCYFSPFADSEAAKCSQNLFERNFAYDAPPLVMLCCSYPPELELQQPYSDYLKVRAQGEENLEKFRKALSEFASASRFADFWTDNEAFYRQIIVGFKRVVGDLDIVGTLEDYYHMSRDGFYVILCPQNGDKNYGPAIPDADGKDAIYALLCPFGDDDGVPVLDRYFSLNLMLHEFSHSFVNPITAKHSDKVMQHSALYEPLRLQMSKQAYTDWMICVNEHIVRAVVIRIFETIGCHEFAEAALKGDQKRNFGYILPLIEKLKEYEKLRDETGISFDEYMPTLLEVFAGLKPDFPQFEGPITSVLYGAKVAAVYPTAGGEIAASYAGIVRSLATRINTFFGEERWVAVADTTALRMSLADCHIVTYGSPKINLLLKKFESVLPFRIENGVLHADREYEDGAANLVVCVPNPQNIELGMVVNTAVDDQMLSMIDNALYEAYDYCIFLNQEHILSRGFFIKKEGKWCFPQL